MKDVEIICVIALSRDVFSTETKDHFPVASLRFVVERSLVLTPYESEQLTLRLAKINGRWLNLEKDNYDQMQQEILARDENIMDLDTFVGSEAFGFSEEGTIGAGDIHVVVELPSRRNGPSRLRSLAEAIGRRWAGLFQRRSQARSRWQDADRHGDEFPKLNDIGEQGLERQGFWAKLFRKRPSTGLQPPNAPLESVGAIPQGATPPTQ